MTAGTNLTPEMVTAYWSHRLSVAWREEERARAARKAVQAGARAEGVSPRVVRAALGLATRDPEAYASEQRALMTVLAALDPPNVELEQYDMFERSSDESREDTLRRRWKSGRMARLTGDLRGGDDLPADEAEAWRNGWEDADEILAAVENHYRARRARTSTQRT